MSLNPTPRPVTLIPVNETAPAPTLNIGIEETTDFAKMYFSAWEVYTKAMADGKITIEDAFLLSGFIMNLFAFVNGANMILPELKDLTEEEKAKLMEVLQAPGGQPNYQLGENFKKAKSIFALLLSGIEVYNTFGN